jgi:hypothetical protein
MKYILFYKNCFRRIILIKKQLLKASCKSDHYLLHVFIYLHLIIVITKFYNFWMNARLLELVISLLTYIKAV